MHGVKVPTTSNISQKCLTFSLEIFKSSGWYFSSNLFKDFFCVLFIAKTTPQKKIADTLIQVTMKLILKQR